MGEVGGREEGEEGRGERRFQVEVKRKEERGLRAHLPRFNFAFFCWSGEGEGEKDERMKMRETKIDRKDKDK